MKKRAFIGVKEYYFAYHHYTGSEGYVTSEISFLSKKPLKNPISK